MNLTMTSLKVLLHSRNSILRQDQQVERREPASRIRACDGHTHKGRRLVPKDAHATVISGPCSGVETLAAVQSGCFWSENV